VPQRKFPAQRLFGFRPVHDLSGCLGDPCSASVRRTPRLLNGITTSVHTYGAGVYFESYCGHRGFGDSVCP